MLAGASVGECRGCDSSGAAVLGGISASAGAVGVQSRGVVQGLRRESGEVVLGMRWGAGEEGGSWRAAGECEDAFSTGRSGEGEDDEGAAV